MKLRAYIETTIPSYLTAWPSRDQRLTMRERDILAEIRAVRDELARRHGGDARLLSQALAERSHLAGRVLVRFAPRPPQPPLAVGAQPETGESAPHGPDSAA